MTYERPVTGSCERCGRGHGLLIPEPGSGDMHLQRVAARFAWCAGCERLVGRECCWIAYADLCADCDARMQASDTPGIEANLVGGALDAIAAAADSLASAEAALARMPVREADVARNAWEDAWLEAAALAARAKSAARLIRRRGDALPGAGARLVALSRTWQARARAIDGRLRGVGIRVRALSAVPAGLGVAAGRPAGDGRPRAGPSGAVTILTVPRPVVVRQRVASRALGLLEPVVVTAPPSGPTPHGPMHATPAQPPHATPAESPHTTPAEPTHATPAESPHTTPAEPTHATPAEPTTPVSEPPRRVRRAAAATPPAPIPESEAVAVPIAVTSPSISTTQSSMAWPASARPAPHDEMEPATVHRRIRGRRRRSVVIALVVALSLIGAGVALATFVDPTGLLGSAARPTTEASLPGGASAPESTEPSPTIAAGQSEAAVPVGSGPAVTFDLEPLGPISDDTEGIALVIGSPEVAALPTSFDRSLRLGGGAGVCITEPTSGGPARALTSDLVVEPGAAPDLRIVPVDRPEQGVTIAMGDIPLVTETWYRLRVTWEQDGIILDVRHRDGGRQVHHAEIEATPSRAGSDVGSVCIEALRADGASALHVDNIRVET